MELKNKDSLEGLNGRLELEKRRIRDMKDKSFKIIHFEEQKEKPLSMPTYTCGTPRRTWEK